MQALCLLMSLAGEEGQIASPPAAQQWQDTLVCHMSDLQRACMVLASSLALHWPNHCC